MDCTCPMFGMSCNITVVFIQQPLQCWSGALVNAQVHCGKILGIHQVEREVKMHCQQGQIGLPRVNQYGYLPSSRGSDVCCSVGWLASWVPGKTKVNK